MDINIDNNQNKSNKGKRSKFKVFMKVVGGLMVFGIVSMVVAGGVVYYKVKPLMDEAKEIAYEKLTDIDEETFINLSDTVIYDNNGDKLGEINISNFEYAEIGEISKFIQDGYIAVEDVNFAKHNGIDYKALLRAGIALIKNKGTVTQGGSTITQQVLKNNVIGTDIDKWDRKFIEVFLAPEFEKMFSKADIMEFYCNSNFYQNNCYGVETASLYYFGKHASDVTLAEAALLVGLSNNPSAYNPVKHPEAALEKRHFVLSRMLEEGKITEEQFKEADKEELVLVLERESRVKESYQVSFAIHCAALELMEEDGFKFKYVFNNSEEYTEYKSLYDEEYSEKANAIRGGGYKIYTSLDNTKQQKLQEVVDNVLSVYTEKADDGRYAMQGSATLVDNNTGYVVAIVGGRGVEDEYNRAYQAYRQPGSSIKPIIDYAPAFETGLYYPSMVLKDEYIDGGPSNSNGRYVGNISIRDAIAKSTNTIAWEVLDGIGISTGVNKLGKLRFSGLSYQDLYNNSMALGGFTYGTTTFEMAKAYSVLVNGGTYKDETCITRLEYQDGTVYDCDDNDIQVYTPDSAFMVLDCLKGVMEYGTGASIDVGNQIIAGKTGTTNDKKDGWFCGASKYYSLAVWCGYDMPRAISGLYGSTYPGEIFSQVMRYVHDGLEPVDFVKPDTVFSGNVNWKGDLVDYNSGKMDYFSQTAIDKLEAEEQAIKEEEERKAAEEASRAEALKLEEVRLDIETFGTISVSEVDAIEELDSEYSRIKKTINKLSDAGMRSECLEKLNKYYETINSLTVTKQLRDEIADMERKKAEEEAKRKAEEAQRKLEALQSAESALNELEGVIRDGMEYSDVLGKVNSLIEACKGYAEQSSLLERLESILSLVEDDTNIEGDAGSIDDTSNGNSDVSIDPEE